MPTIDRLNAVASNPKFVDRIYASADTEILVPKQLLRLFVSAGIQGPADVDKLDEAQLNRLLQDRTFSDRIGIKQAVDQCGLYPRTLPRFRTIPNR